MRHQPRRSLVQIIACHLAGHKPLSEPMLENCQLDPWEKTCIWNDVREMSAIFFSASMCWHWASMHNDQTCILQFNYHNILYIKVYLTKSLSYWLTKWYVSPGPKTAGRCACLGEFAHLLGITWLWEVILSKLGRTLLRKGLPWYMPYILYLAPQNGVLHGESL